MAAACAMFVGIVAAAPAMATPSTPNGPASAGETQQPRIAITGSTPTWARPPLEAGKVDPGQTRHVQIALALRDPAGAAAMARAVSAPSSPRYRHNLTAEQFTARFGPAASTVDQVSTWLRAQGLTVNGVAVNRHFIDATAPVSRLEAAFATTLHRYHHRDGFGRVRDLVAPDTAVSVPAPLRPQISAVLGLDDSAKTITARPAVGKTHAPTSVGSRPSAAQRPAASGTGCAQYWQQVTNPAVPQKYPGAQSNILCGYNYRQLRSMYGLTPAQTGAGTHVGIVGAYDSATAVSDANRAATTYGAPPLSPSQYNVIRPQGGDRSDPACEGPESWAAEHALDVQALHTTAPAAHLTWYGATNCLGLFAALNSAVAADQVSVINNSWLTPDETDVPPAVRNQLQQITVQAAVQGQALTFASGDSGDNSGVAGHPVASFPASDPWVTAVGGTTVALDSNARPLFTTGWESAADNLSGGRWVPQQDKDGPMAGGAGGGPSALYAEPAYQRRAVPSGHREVPDISALADVYTGMGVGFTGPSGYVNAPTGGTSLASPLIAGLAADAESAAHLDRLGFLDPALYAMNGSALADVRPHPSGIYTRALASFGGVSTPTGPGDYLIENDARPQTLQSGPGWDPVTGLGTPTAGFVAALGR